MNRLITASRGGWQSARANLIPGLVIISVAALIAAAYYLLPAVREQLVGLQRLREQGGIWFTIGTGAVGAGLLPGLYLMSVGRARRDGRGLVDLVFTCLIWALTLAVVDRFYLFQAWLWGTAVTLPVVLAKMLFDQFVFTPLFGVQFPALGFRLRDLNYDLEALGRALRDNWLLQVSVPMLVACWLTWIPGTLVVYALPLSLQTPMMVLIQCFFALEMAYVSRKINPVS